MEDNSREIRNAIRHALDSYGVDVLNQPERIRSLLKDLCNPTLPECVLLQHNCDQHVLAPYIYAIQAGGSHEALMDAGFLANNILVRERGARENVARSLTSQIAEGISDHLYPRNDDTVQVDTEPHQDSTDVISALSNLDASGVHARSARLQGDSKSSLWFENLIKGLRNNYRRCCVCAFGRRCFMLACHDKINQDSLVAAVLCRSTSA